MQMSIKQPPECPTIFPQKRCRFGSVRFKILEDGLEFKSMLTICFFQFDLSAAQQKGSEHCIWLSYGTKPGAQSTRYASTGDHLYCQGTREKKAIRENIVSVLKSIFREFLPN